MRSRRSRRPKTPRPPLPRGQVSFDHVRFGYTPRADPHQGFEPFGEPQRDGGHCGPHRGGKTTLINLLMRFYELDGGAISIDGVDISTIPRSELRRKIGMVLQDTWLFEGTVAENIAYGRKTPHGRRSSPPPRPPGATTLSAPCPRGTTRPFPGTRPSSPRGRCSF